MAAEANQLAACTGVCQPSQPAFITCYHFGPAIGSESP